MSVERLRDIGEEYARLESRLRELKRRLYDVIIKYLIANSAFRDKCTELGISENLGLKRSVVRRVLKELVDAHILYYVEIGRSKPYSILSIGSALDRGYVSFTKREIQELLAVKEIKKEVLRNVFFEVGVSIEGAYRYRGRSDSQVLNVLTRRFFDYVYADIYEKFYKKLGGKEMGLDRLLPESVSFKNLYEASLLKIPGAGLLHVPPDTPIDKALEYSRRYVEEKLKTVLAGFKMFVEMLENMGYDGLVEWSRDKQVRTDTVLLKDEKIERKFRKEYVWAATLMLRDSCRFAKEAGIDPDLIKEALELADMLDLAVEKEYRGKNVEKLSLKEWYLKQRGSNTSDNSS